MAEERLVNILVRREKREEETRKRSNTVRANPLKLPLCADAIGLIVDRLQFLEKFAIKIQKAWCVSLLRELCSVAKVILASQFSDTREGMSLLESVSNSKKWVLYLSGVVCCGKSTLARIVEHRHRLRWAEKRVSVLSTENLPIGTDLRDSLQQILELRRPVIIIGKSPVRLSDFDKDKGICTLHLGNTVRVTNPFYGLRRLPRDAEEYFYLRKLLFMNLNSTETLRDVLSF